MLKCLEINKICSESNRKCKTCKLDSCKETMKLIEEVEKDEEKKILNKLYKELPEQCRHCSFLEVVDLEKMKVKCFFRIKEKCLLEECKNENND